MPGQSGNPGGRRRTDPEVAEALSAACLPAAKKLVELANHEDPRVSFPAACRVLEINGVGKDGALLAALSTDGKTTPDIVREAMQQLTPEMRAVALAALQATEATH